MIRIAVLGAGRWGPNLLRNFEALDDAEVVSVVDPDASRLARLREAFPRLRYEHESERVLTDESIDAVVVATPTSTHYGLVKAALLAGKHVMVEKPITKTSSEARELDALARERKRTLLVGHIFLFNPAIARAKQAIKAGTLGQLSYLSMERTNLGPVRMDIHAGWDLASHDLSIANWWLDTSPISVSATAGAWINPGIPDAVFATFRYPNDVLCNIHVSWLHPHKARGIVAVGSERMLHVDDMDADTPLHLYDKRITEEHTNVSFADGNFRITPHDGGEEAIPVMAGEPMKAECAEFLACIRDGRESHTGGTLGVEVVTALEAMDRSIESGGAPVPIESK